MEEVPFNFTVSDIIIIICSRMGESCLYLKNISECSPVLFFIAFKVSAFRDFSTSGAEHSV